MVNVRTLGPETGTGDQTKGSTPSPKKTQYFIVLKTKKSKSTELVNLCMNVLNFYVTLYCTRDGVVCSI